MAAALADSINEHADLISSGTVPARFAGLIATCLTTSRQFFDADNNWSHIEKILATGPNGINVLHKYFVVASPRPQAVLETLHDAEGLVAMWGSAINQLKDDFAVLAAVGEDEDQRGYLAEVKKHLSQTAMKLQTDWQQFNQKAAYSNFFHAAPVDPFVAPEQIRTKFAGEVTTLCIASLLYTYDAAALATMFFSAHRGQSLLPLEGLPNWPAIATVVRGLSNYVRRFKKPYVILSKKECKYLRAKLRYVASLVFNSAEARAAIEVVASREFVEPRLALLTPGEPVPPPADRVAPALYHAEVFRLLATLRHTIRPIDGDGNCFFRAVIRFMFPAITRELEDIYSIMLRERVNNMQLSERSKERLAGFEIEKESDAKTMANVGVWADHTQIERLSEYLRTNVWLVHLRDRKIVMRHNGRLVPSEDYKIGHYPDADGEERDRHRPIVLYYTPVPGHYEPLIFERKRKSGVRVFSAADIPLVLSQAAGLNNGTPPAETLCDAYFALENDLAKAEKHTNQVRDWTSVVTGEAAAVREERDRLVDDCARGTAYLKHLLDQLGPKILSAEALVAAAPAAAAPVAPAAGPLEASVLPQSQPMLSLAAEILRGLVDDGLVIVENEVVVIGRGPLSELVRKLKQLRVPHSRSDDFSSLRFVYEKSDPKLAVRQQQR